MLISYQWLKEFLSLKITPRQLSQLLSLQGLEARVASSLDKDTMIEIEATSNRPDCLSVMGVGREVAAKLNCKIKLPRIDGSVKTGKRGSVAITIKKSLLCPRYLGVLIECDKFLRTPSLIVKRLEKAGIRSINLVVDVTNYVLLECGHPTHAFDADLLEGPRIVVDIAGSCTKLKTLDGVERSLDKDMLLIWDKKKPIAIAGVMGCENSEIHPGTKRVFIESAYFDPKSIRLTSKKLNLSTESSFRFERGLDPEGADYAMRRILFLLKKTQKIKILGLINDCYPKPIRQKKILFRVSRLNHVLGTQIKIVHARKILKSLNFVVEGAAIKKDRFYVTPPSYRHEVTREIDLIEEVARIYGYNEIQKQAPSIKIKANVVGHKERIENILKQSLSEIGLYEIINFSFLHPDDLSLSEKAIKIPNPISREQSVMRTSLIPGLLKVAVRNQNIKEMNPWLFEIGHIFLKNPSKKKVFEKNRFSILVAGGPHELKGLVERILAKFQIERGVINTSDHPWLKKNRSLEWLIDGVSIGFFGVLADSVKSKYGLDLNVSIGEFDFDRICQSAKLDKKYAPIPKYPAVYRDMALIVDEGVSYQDCVECIKTYGGSWLEDVNLFDLYRGSPLKTGKKSMGFSLAYRDASKTLTEKDVDVPHEKILHACFQKLGAELRPN
ncbi:phenylalanine--tRNA ligase subunit beta [PVC group bacterium]|nr:phenylalanine--tRNA ligase subunit beta [PVC group bacterium]